MTFTALSLVDGARVMLLYPRDDLVVLGWGAAWPTIRAVVENRPDDDGERDTTTRHGGRAVAVELRIIDNPEVVLDELGGFLAPSARPYLTAMSDAWAGPRRMRLRIDQAPAPVDADMPPSVRDVQAQWRAPDGVWEAVDEAELVVAADIPSHVGRTYPRSHPWSYAATGAAGALSVTNLGNAESHFTARLYGPCSAPQLLNDLTGERIAFTSALTLGAGEYIEIDTRARSAYLNSDASLNRLGLVDYGAPNTWWRLQRGTQQIRYTATAPEVGSQAVITYRPNWL